MNQRELIRVRTKNKAKLEISSWKNIDRLEIDIGNSPEHELTKTICFMLLKEGVPAENLPNIFNVHNPLSYIIFERGIEDMVENWGNEIKHEWERPQIVTEARFKPYFTPTKGTGFFKNLKCVTSNIGRRADLFILDTGEIVEIETDHKISKNGAITVYI